MKPLDWYLKCRLYARKYPASAKDFEIAVPPLDECREEWFKIAGELLSIRVEPWRIRTIFLRMIEPPN